MALNEVHDQNTQVIAMSLLSHTSVLLSSSSSRPVGERTWNKIDISVKEIFRAVYASAEKLSTTTTVLRNSCSFETAEQQRSTYSGC